VSLGDDKINSTLRQHQQDVETWDRKEKVQQLLIWLERLVSEFKLEVGVPALMVDRLRCTRYGHFRRGRDGFGLLGEVGINDMYIGEELSWRNLATLLHELGHVHQEKTGKPGKRNYHNKQFRDWAKSVGLIVDAAGHTRMLPLPSPFWDVLRKWDFPIPDSVEQEVAATRRRGTSKLKLWICDCKPKPVRVRVAIADFQARCLKCGQVFALHTC
jgi:hypothetical protein